MNVVNNFDNALTEFNSSMSRCCLLSRGPTIQPKVRVNGERHLINDHEISTIAANSLINLLIPD